MPPPQKRRSLSSTEAYRGVFARFMHSMHKKLLLYTEVAQLAANPTRASLETFHPSDHDNFRMGSLPAAALKMASRRQAAKVKSEYDKEAHTRIAVGNSADSPVSHDALASSSGSNELRQRRPSRTRSRSRSPSPSPSPTAKRRYLAPSPSPERKLTHKDSGGSIMSHSTQSSDDTKKKHKPHVHHHKHFHPEVSHRELFFDLIYVVVCIELGIYLNSNLTWGQLGYTFLLFLSFWLDWFHTNSINSCIRMTNPWIGLLIVVIIGPLGLAAHAISEGIGKESKATAVGTLSDHRIASSIFLLLPRLAFLIIYANIWVFTDPVNDSFPQSRRRQSGIFCVGFIITTSLCIAMACVEDSSAVLAMWITLDVIEVLLYPIAALTIKPIMQWKVAPAFAKERDTLWVLLVLGETVLSLGMYGQTKDVDYYLNLFLGFFLIYSILRLFLLSQPTKSDIIHHALYGSAIWVFLRNLCIFCMSFGILCVGVSMKAVMVSSTEPYTRTNAFLLTCGVACAMFFMNLCRYTHIFVVSDQDALIYGMNYNAAHGRLRRYAVWGVQAFLSLGLIPLALAVDMDGNGLSAPGLLGVLNAYVFVVGIVDLAARPTQLEQELLMRMKTPIRLSDLMAGYIPSPPRESTLPPGPLSPVQKTRAQERWARLFHGFAIVKYAEVKAETLHRYATNELVRPGLSLHHRESQLEALFGHVVATSKAALSAQGSAVRPLSVASSSTPHTGGSAGSRSDGAPDVKIIDADHLLGEDVV